jgi:hypothetical protein
LTLVEQVQRQADQDNTLLQTAFAYKLVDLIEPAANRASKLVEVVVKEPSSEEADHYLEEASQCYFFGLFTACVIMCRSLLEEVLEQKLPTSFLESRCSGNKESDMTLGKLLHEVNNSELAAKMPAGFLRAARVVNQLGNRGAHVSSASPDKAWKCLKQARAALTLLLGSTF